MRVAGLTALALCTSALSGCEEREAQAAVTAKLPDAAYHSFQSVARHGETVCGEVNAGEMGGGNGYTRFIYRQGIASVAPRITYTPSDVAGFDTTCRMLGGRGNGLDRQVCTQATEARRLSAEAAQFDALWQRSCG